MSCNTPPCEACGDAHTVGRTNFLEPLKDEVPGIHLLGRTVNKGKRKGQGGRPGPLEVVAFGSQETAVVVIFLHVPGLPPSVHTNSAPFESIKISPWR